MSERRAMIDDVEVRFGQLNSDGFVTLEFWKDGKKEWGQMSVHPQQLITHTLEEIVRHACFNSIPVVRGRRSPSIDREVLEECRARDAARARGEP